MIFNEQFVNSGTMQPSLESTERDAFFVHLLFIILCAVVLLLPVPLLIGPRLFLLVVVYNILIPVIGYWRGHLDWLYLWIFVVLISLLMIFPDWFLVNPLDTLIFQPDGFPKIGPVSGYMTLLWAIPLFIIVFLGLRLAERHSKSIAYGIVVLTSFLIFTAAEVSLTFVWHAQNVTMIGNVALYIIIPEIILGLSTFWTYQTIQNKSHWWKPVAAFLIMLLYLGSACFFYLLIEIILLGP
jgi:hypothetical protein